MRNSDIIIVDDFYANPHIVRDHALNSKFNSGATYNYPGWQSDVYFNASQIPKIISSLVGREIILDSERFTWGAFRIVTARTGSMTKVHADTGVDWAGMVYLTPDLPAGTGTGFYRHKETGLYGPPTPAIARKLGYANTTEFEKKVVRRDMADLNLWELDTMVAARFNRLVLFKGGRYYHAPMGGSGDDLETARLTQNFFFDEMSK